MARLRGVFLLFILLVGSLASVAQGWLSPGEMNRVLNSAFSNLVTSNTNPGEIATNASLDPVACSFSLKASFPFRPLGKKIADTTESLIRQHKGSFSYLGFTASGNLLDKSYTTLFSQGALNSAINVQAQYNFKLNSQHFGISATDMGAIALQRDLLFQSYQRQSEALDETYNVDHYSYTVRVLQKEVEAAKERLGSVRDSNDLLIRTMDSLHWQIEGRPELADKLGASQKKVASQQQSLSLAQNALDSLQWAGRAWGSVYFSKRAALVKQMKKDYDSILASTNLSQLSTTWFTLTSGVGKKCFYTFDPGQPFTTQLNSNTLVTYNFGVGVNYMNIDKLREHTVFLSATASYLRDNNLACLSTSELYQTKTSVNAGGDTTRTVTTKFNVYTSPVVTYQAANLTGQAYYVWGKQPMGVHLSPSVTIEQNGPTVSNLTTGFIFVFKTGNKDQPVLNTEFYVTGVDLFDQQKIAGGLGKRSVVGLSLTVPVNLFMK
jgi:hypothetical protein